jgi:hypothetical protein
MQKKRANPTPQRPQPEIASRGCDVLVRPDSALLPKQRAFGARFGGNSILKMRGFSLTCSIHQHSVSLNRYKFGAVRHLSFHSASGSGIELINVD